MSQVPDLHSRLPTDAGELISVWFEKVRESQNAHYHEEKITRRYHYALGLPAIGLATLVGTTTFATLQEESLAIWLRVSVGLVSILAAILSALQTFLRFDERADKHHMAGAEYGALRRMLQEAKLWSEAEKVARLPEIRQKYDELSLKAPVLSMRE